MKLKLIIVILKRFLFRWSWSWSWSHIPFWFLHSPLPIYVIPHLHRRLFISSNRPLLDPNEYYHFSSMRQRFKFVINILVWLIFHSCMTKQNLNPSSHKLCFDMLISVSILMFHRKFWGGVTIVSTLSYQRVDKCMKKEWNWRSRLVSSLLIQSQWILSLFQMCHCLKIVIVIVIPPFPSLALSPVINAICNSYFPKSFACV